jgi:hypothetical protein
MVLSTFSGLYGIRFGKLLLYGIRFGKLLSRRERQDQADKIKQKTFKGPVVHNKNFERHIKGFKGPKDASDSALTTIIAWLDNTDTLWSISKHTQGASQPKASAGPSSSLR